MRYWYLLLMFVLTSCATPYEKRSNYQLCKEIMYSNGDTSKAQAELDNRWDGKNFCQENAGLIQQSYMAEMQRKQQGNAMMMQGAAMLNDASKPVYNPNQPITCNSIQQGAFINTNCQ